MPQTARFTTKGRRIVHQQKQKCHHLFQNNGICYFAGVLYQRRILPERR